jgi:predicted NBD/HSP70 family sugar kinase
MALKKKTLFTVRLSADREKKNLLFLNLIKTRKSTSRTELSKLTDINIVTVSNYVNSYIKKGLVAETGFDISSGGRRPELIEVNRKWGHVIGIDIGEGYIKGVLAGLDMEILASEALDSYDTKNLKGFLDKIIQNLLSASKVEKGTLRKIGIGVSAVSGNVMEDAIRIKYAMEEDLGVPVLCGNGATCGASGEKNLNPGAIGANRILYIYGDIGEGVLIRADEFYEPSDEARSFVYLKPWAYSLGIVSAAKKMLKEGVKTKMAGMAGGDTGHVTLDTVLKAAGKNDEAAMDLVRTTGVNLGVRVAYLMNLFEPESVIIGGGVEEAGSLFLDSLNLSVDKFVKQEIKDKVKLRPGVSGRDACAKGAAFLALREALIEA